MIRAEHKKWARLVFNPYINRLLKKSFSNFYLVNDLPSLPSNKSLVITPNHFSWWDGFFIDYISRKSFDRTMYLMMLETSLQRYWFFKKVGAFSIEPNKPRSIVETVNYTNEVLKDRNNFVVTYVQGELESFEKRPFSIKEGLKLFLNKNQTDKVVLPVGFKIHYYDKQKPAVICRFGNLLSAKEVNESYDIFKEKFTENLDLLKKAAENKEFKEDLFL